ncbi:DUF2252 domain-containing protein [Gluconobacter morbifer]|uniref:DUF2252 domain-containing protein n=1 Tax=Gluconobacter morbifer G707 TaxID=1088869 RepID=G6XI36_9PROT|nr:DUF2252 domain-containing protein [Gluconobacter morbifer]EHH68476.1 hypothetical protein GMO_12460 [Gluconobacter morbifer G707]
MASLTPSVPVRSRQTRYAAGMALRKTVPRSSHAPWTPTAKRADPVSILLKQGTTRISTLLPIRHQRMKASPLAFLRGAAAVMAADLATTPTTGLRVQACGDCHLNNFGCYPSPEGIPVFDINDFDETAPAPFEWDLKRLVTSLVLAGREASLPEKACQQLAVSASEQYVAEIHRLATMPPLQAWNERIDVRAIISGIGGHKTRDRMRRQLDRQLGAISNQFGMIDPSSARQLKEKPPFVRRLPENNDIVRDAFGLYVAQLPPERRIVLERYALQDVIFKVVGVGSVGTFCALGLFTTGDNDPLILQIKEAQTSVLEPYAGVVPFANHGQRVVVGQRIMQATSDAFLGWTHTDGKRTTKQVGKTAGGGRDFYVRQTKDSRLALIGEKIEDDLLPEYAELCGRTLGRAHGRSADLAVLSGYLGRGRSFSAAIAEFATHYADQSEQDWRAFVQAIAEKRVSCA